MDQPPLQQALDRKEPEFIDHSLLTPTYIRDSNNFIIDFIESTPLVFPNKTVVHVSGNNGSTHTTSATNLASTVGDGSYHVKESDTVSITPDLHFPSSIFHYRPTQSDVAAGNVASVAEAALNALNTSAQPTAPLPLVIGGSANNSGNNAATFHGKHAEYIGLNSDFLAGSVGKSYCNDNQVVHEAGEDAAVQEFLLTDANVSLDEAADLMNASADVLSAQHVSIARKVLPHKKRISRKLRVSQSGADNVLPKPLGGVHKVREKRLKVPIYSCEICGNTSDSQLQFFAHLKQHYEPTTPDTILAAMKTSLEDLEPQKMCVVDKKSPNDNVDQVFNDVHLNFPDFSGVDETPIRDVMEPDDEANEISFVARTSSPTLKRTVEVEFSDSEDMLEGIRNVVDKVSIEDTCDALDLMNSNGMRASWFSNDNFSGITFKNKPFSDVSFTEPLPPMPMMASNSLTRGTPPKAPTPLPPAEKLLSYQKSDRRRKKIVLALPPDDVGGVNIVDEAETDRGTFYNGPLSLIRLPCVDTDDRQLQCQSPHQSTTPTDLLQPLRVSEFELPEPQATQAIPDENAHLTAVGLAQVKGEAGVDDSLVVVKDEFCKEEPQTYDFEDNDACLDGDDQGIESYAPSPLNDDLESNFKKLICTKCGRNFNSTNALKYHARTHTGLRPHKCDVCGKSFLALNALKAHTRVHTGDKPFKCEVCQRDFGQWGDLQYHFISKHTEDKNHQCEFCGKAFSRRYSLVLHRRIHTCERNFKCEYCQKTFRASAYLQNHRKIHTGEKPHECAVCAKRFRMHGDLRRHERIHQRPRTKKSAKRAVSAK
ncbi:uncharacterized protein LOC128864344 isoform X2 [Anastrepha ludens]|uniref:uncharacterized protein LOC128864344 isoform X2 n=1 Tax=Anastrepha ludens TaxID=28586 RepID=UPI0023B08C72|nr:uncharacterized protein LOC128864344 isoform X2 [Anastrepha ludens]